MKMSNKISILQSIPNRWQYLRKEYLYLMCTKVPYRLLAVPIYKSFNQVKKAKNSLNMKEAAECMCIPIIINLQILMKS